MRKFPPQFSQVYEVSTSGTLNIEECFGMHSYMIFVGQPIMTWCDTLNKTDFHSSSAFIY